MSKAISTNTIFGYKPFNETSETAVRMMLRAPYFMALYYSMSIYEMPSDLPRPYNTLATNGVSVWVNREFWRQLDRDHKLTAVAHELGHKMLLHSTRMGSRDRSIWNIAGDHVINLMLQESGFKPLAGLTINNQPWNWYADTKYKGWSTEQVYDDLLESYEKEAQSRGQGQPNGQGGEERAPTAGSVAAGDMGAEADLVEFGEAPDGQADQTVADRNETGKDFEQRVQRELKQGEQQAQAQGKTPAWMERVIAHAEHVKVAWYDVLAEYIRSIHRADYSWHRFSKREFVKCGIISPDLYQPAMGGVKVFVDCSGSIGADTLNKFNRHFRDVLDQVRPAWTEVSYFHTHVMHELDQRFERTDYEAELKPGGSGGTDFSWLADEVEAMEEAPDVVLFLTDMYGSFGRECSVPTIWVSISSVEQAPFGTVICVN